MTGTKSSGTLLSSRYKYKISVPYLSSAGTPLRRLRLELNSGIDPLTPKLFVMTSMFYHDLHMHSTWLLPGQMLALSASGSAATSRCQPFAQSKRGCPIVHQKTHQDNCSAAQQRRERMPGVVQCSSGDKGAFFLWCVSLAMLEGSWNDGVITYRNEGAAREDVASISTGYTGPEEVPQKSRRKR